MNAFKKLLEPTPIDHHVFATYKYLRIGIIILGVSFPSLLYLSGACNDCQWQESWSAYYHVSDTSRNLFVGVLWAMGVFLVLYRGYTQLENILLDIGGVCAIGVAMFPMNRVFSCIDETVTATSSALQSHNVHGFVWSDVHDTSVHALLQLPLMDNPTLVSVHGIAAFVFFISAAAVAFFTSRATLKKDEDIIFWYLYPTIGALMIIVPIIIYIFTYLKIGLAANVTFLIESVGIFIFAVYWLVKTFELVESRNHNIMNSEGILKGMGLKPVAEKH